MNTYFKNYETSSKHSQEVFWFFVLYNSYLEQKVKSFYYFDQLGRKISYYMASSASS